jgi:hypothetical protein
MENIYKPHCDACGISGPGVYYQFTPQNVITCQKCRPEGRENFARVVVTEVLTQAQVQEIYGDKWEQNGGALGLPPGSAAHYSSESSRY